MHFQGNFYQISGVECGEVVSKLLCIGVFLEKRGNRIRTLANMITTPPTIGGAFDGRYVLLADSDSIQNRDCVTLLKLSDVDKRIQTGEGKKQTVAFFAPKFKSFNISLFRVKVSASRSAVLILATQ